MIKYFLVLICAVCSVFSCKKYDDGPMLSFRTRSARVANTWKVKLALRNGSDITSSYNNYNEIFSKEGDYSYVIQAGQLKTEIKGGVWEFQNKDGEIKISSVPGQSTRTIFILRLKQNEFWYEYYLGNDKIEIRLETK